MQIKKKEAKTRGGEKERRKKEEARGGQKETERWVKEDSGQLEEEDEEETFGGLGEQLHIELS